MAEQVDLGGAWSPEQLELIDAADELEIAVARADGTLRRWTPIWAVRNGDEVFVRTWHRRDTGWYGQALRSRQARARVPGLEVAVEIDDVAAYERASVDAAYRAKYRRYGGSVDSMVSGEAVATTLRLRPSPET
jgi:hypothetical protein